MTNDKQQLSVHPSPPLASKKAVRLLFGALVVAMGLLVAFGFYTGEPIFFLRWFFGLQADD